MKDLEKHVGELDELLKSKGYDGFFLSEGAHPGRLSESLGNFYWSYVNGGEHDFKFPPTLTTYGYWEGMDKRSVECRFKLEHNDNIGFSIKTLELESRDRYGLKDKQKVIGVASIADIPECRELKCWAHEPALKTSATKSKALKI